MAAAKVAAAVAIDSHNMSSEARKGAVLNYLNLLLIVVTGVVLTPFVIRYLGASQYGLYSLMGSVIPYITLLDLGLGKTITRYISHYRARHDEEGEARFLTTAAHIYAAVVVFLLLLGAVVYCHVDDIWGGRFTAEELDEVRRMLVIVVLTQVVIVPGSAFTSICYGCGFFAFPRGVQLVKYVVRTLCIVVLLLCGYKAVALIALEALLNVLIVVVTYCYVRRRIGRRSIFSREHGSYREVMSYAAWIALYAATCAMQWGIAPLIAGVTTDAATVGVVGVGVLLGNMYGYFAETINRMTMPRASNFVKGNPTGQEVTDEMIRVGHVVALILTVVLGAFIIFGRAFVALWAGELYEEAYCVALIIMCAGVVQLSQDYGNVLLEAQGRVRVMSVINFICIFVAAFLSYFASRYRGIVSMVGVLAVGTLMATVVSNVYYKHRLQLDTARYFKTVFAPLAVVLAVCVVVSVVLERYAVMPRSWLWMAVGITLYVVIIVPVIYGLLLTDEERKRLKEYVQSKRR